MLEVNGKNLISRALENISYLEVSKIIIIIDYEGENLKVLVAITRNPISYVWNKSMRPLIISIQFFLQRMKLLR